MLLTDLMKHCLKPSAVTFTPHTVALLATVWATPAIAQSQTGSQSTEAAAPSGFFAILFSGGITGFIIVSILIALSVYSSRVGGNGTTSARHR
jgi:hypothetical protein